MRLPDIGIDLDGLADALASLAETLSEIMREIVAASIDVVGARLQSRRFAREQPGRYLDLAMRLRACVGDDTSLDRPPTAEL